MICRGMRRPAGYARSHTFCAFADARLATASKHRLEYVTTHNPITLTEWLRSLNSRYSAVHLLARVCMRGIRTSALIALSVESAGQGLVYKETSPILLRFGSGH